MMGFRVFLEAGYRNLRDCKYWGDSGAGILPFAKSTKKFLLNQRGIGTNEGGTYGVFGGGIFLKDFGLSDSNELINTDIPRKVALKELKEETGYSGTIELREIYVHKDNLKNHQGEPCNFYYWTFLGIVPEEFPLEPGKSHRWEVGEGSNWFTYQEMLAIQPKHFGLEALLKNVGNKLKRIR